MSRIKNYKKNAPLKEKLKKEMLHHAGNFIHAIGPAFLSPFNKRESFNPGISVTMITKNDLWIKESLQSIVESVDEIVIIDSSDPEHSEYNKTVVSEVGKGKIVYKNIDVDIFNARKIAHGLATKEWILRWDGDMIAYDSGPNAFSELVSCLRKLGSKKSYYEVLFPVVTIANDLNSVSEEDYQIEAWAYSNSRKFNWTLRNVIGSSVYKAERLVFPFYYRKKYISTPFGIHLKYLLPANKLMIKGLQFKWMTPSVQEKYSGDYGKFFKEMAETASAVKYNGNSLPYSAGKYGEIPSIVKKYAGLSGEQIISNKLSEYNEYITRSKINSA